MHAQFSLLKPFSIVGELSFFDEQPRSADVIALEDDSEVLVIPFEQLRKLAPASFYQKLSKNKSKCTRWQ